MPMPVDLIAPEATLTINVVAGDDILNLAESQTNQTISNKVAGEFLPNDLVTFTLNGTTYSAAVNASGDWSVPVTNKTISGKAGGEFQAGDLVTFTLNGHVYSAAVNASGDWSVAVSGARIWPRRPISTPPWWPTISPATPAPPWPTMPTPLT